MKFILNTAVDPHFCTLFDDEGKRVSYHQWQDRRRDGKELWEFLNKQNSSNFTFLGGISGPGGFSSLRAGAGVINALAFTTGLPIHSVRADFLQKALLKDERGAVVLNSFGDGVWMQEGKELTRKPAAEAGESFAQNPVCISWIPIEKQAFFKNPVSVDMEKAPEILLRLLETTKEQSMFVPDYEVPAVE